MTKKQKGFTLVELMIVVAIIGILAAVAIPKFADMLEKSREGATKGYISAMKSAVANYLADNGGSVPRNLDSDTWIDATQGNAIYPPYVAGNTNTIIIRLSTYMDNIPSVKVTAKNKTNLDNKNGPGQGPSAAHVAYGWYIVEMGGSAVDGSLSDWQQGNSMYARGTTNTHHGKGWRYDRTSGSIWVNSAELDMRGISYTMFGYE